jgi:murein DD-endopeptidase MepM/ murein hydrolase activator NlpD
MEMNFIVISLVTLVLSTSSVPANPCSWFLPINLPNRQSWEEVRLTRIGQFGLLRKARPKIPAHYHTAVDFMRPGDNYDDEPIFPAARGIVISQRTDGPYAQVIIEHNECGDDTVWTVYEHLAGVKVVVGDTVDPQQPIGRFMTKPELNKYGWQFDHLHFEMLRQRPLSWKPTNKTPMRLFKVYSLECYTKALLARHYHDPQEFFESCWREANEAGLSNP